MKKSGLYIAAVTMMAATLMVATPVVSWADEIQRETVIESLEIEAFDEEEDLPDDEAKDAVDMALDVILEGIAEDARVANASARRNLVNYALQFVGGKYRTGGNDPHTGADCSGFVKYVMQHGAGISMNRSSVSQSTQGRQISAEEMQPGDLIFYGDGSRINHVAMYIGDGQIVHASTHKTGIKISKWNYRSPVKIVSMMG